MRKKVSYNIDKKLCEEFKSKCESEDKTQASVLRRIINKYYIENENKNE